MKKNRHIIFVLLILCGISLPSSVLAVMVEPPADGGGSSPAPPILYSIPSPEFEAQLSWSSVSEAASYLIFRSNSAYGDYDRLNSTTECTYTDSSADPGYRWYYIKSKNSNGIKSEPSNRQWVQITVIKITSPLDGETVQQHSDYYPATYGFDFDTPEQVPSGWTSVCEENGYTKVVENCDDHNKVLECADNGGDYNISNTFTSQENGSVEFYTRVTTSTEYNAFYFGLYSDNTELILLEFMNQKLCVRQFHVGVPPEGSYYYWLPLEFLDVEKELEMILDDRWYHFRIDFWCSGDNPNLSINVNNARVIIDDCFISYPFEILPNAQDDLNRLSFYTEEESIQEQTCWIDAVGYSWDDHYNPGDNLEEGLKLEMNGEEEVISIEYKVDEEERKPISGDCIIPLSKNISLLRGETHEITLFGEWDIGKWCYSNSIEIEMKGEKIAVFAWSSAIEADGNPFIRSSNINQYINILEGESYTKFFKYRGSYTPLHDLYVVQRYETELDEVFFSFIGHGTMVNEEYSIIDYTIPLGWPIAYPLNSSDFRDKIIAGMESQKKAWLVDSCQSGGFVRNFKPYDPDTNPDGSYIYLYHDFLAMSATDYIHGSLGGFSTRYFTYRFFYNVDMGNTAVESFFTTKNSIINFCPLWIPEPQIYDNSPSKFFR